MDKLNWDKLKMLDAKHQGSKQAKEERLKVYYGWSRINKIQKREAIAIAFENEAMAGSEGRRSGKSLRKWMDFVTERWQTPEESRDAEQSRKVFTLYYIFMDDKKIGGSLDKALNVNAQADFNHVDEEQRSEIKTFLRQAYLNSHPGYRDPEAAP